MSCPFLPRAQSEQRRCRCGSLNRPVAAADQDATTFGAMPCQSDGTTIQQRAIIAFKDGVDAVKPAVGVLFRAIHQVTFAGDGSAVNGVGLRPGGDYIGTLAVLPFCRFAGSPGVPTG